MVSNSPKKLNKALVHDIAIEIHLLVEEREGLQDYTGRQVEYAFHAALLMVDAAARHEASTHRVALFRTAIAMFADIAEADYIQPLHRNKPTSATTKNSTQR